MKGSIITRQRTDRKTGRSFTVYYAVYDAGQKWSEEKGRWVRNQVWEGPHGTKRAAQRILNDRLSKVQQGEWERPKQYPLSQLATSWFEKDVGPRLKKRSLVSYRIYLDKHILPALGSMDVQRIRSEDIQGFVAQLLSNGVSVHYTRLITSALRAILQKGVEWGYLKVNPAQIKIRYPQEQKEEISPLSASEARELLRCASGQWHAFFAMSIWTGMRVGELMAAKWEHVDWKGQRYHVRETLQPDHSFTTPKTTGSIAPVFLSPFLIETLKAHRRRQAAEKLRKGSGWGEGDLIFTTKSGGSLAASTVRNHLWRTLERAELRRIRLHDLRHTCASLLIAQGANIKIVQKQLRHSTIEMTLNVYGHLYPEDQAAVMRSLDHYILDPTAQRSGSV